MSSGKLRLRMVAWAVLWCEYQRRDVRVRFATGGLRASMFLVYDERERGEDV